MPNKAIIPPIKTAPAIAHMLVFGTSFITSFGTSFTFSLTTSFTIVFSTGTSFITVLTFSFVLILASFFSSSSMVSRLRSKGVTPFLIKISADSCATF